MNELKHIFTEYEATQSTIDFYFEDEGLFGNDGNGIILDENKDYDGMFFVSDATKRAFEEAREQTSNERDICEALTKATGKQYAYKTIKGYCQSDWQGLFYPVEDFKSEHINEIEAYYFGMISEWVGEESEECFTLQHNTIEAIKSELASITGYDAKNIVLRVVDGYIRTPQYKEV